MYSGTGSVQVVMVNPIIERVVLPKASILSTHHLILVAIKMIAEHNFTAHGESMVHWQAHTRLQS
jgi:hypothetical protein